MCGIPYVRYEITVHMCVRFACKNRVNDENKVGHKMYVRLWNMRRRVANIFVVFVSLSYAHNIILFPYLYSKTTRMCWFCVHVLSQHSNSLLLKFCECFTSKTYFKPVMVADTIRTSLLVLSITDELMRILFF